MSSLDDAIKAVGPPDPGSDTSALDQAITNVLSGNVSDAGSYTPSNETLRFGPWNTGIHLNPKVADVLSGAGKSMVNLGQGIGQDIGLQSRADVQRMRDTEATLPSNAYTKTGEVIGNVAAAAPAALIPGANTVTGGALIGSAFGLAQPSTSTKETLENTGTGGLFGAAGSAVGKGLGALAGKLSPKADPLLQAAQEKGYVVPPDTTNPSLLNRTVTGIAGRPAINQSAAIENQEITNNLVREEFGLQKSDALMPETMERVRQGAGQAYDAIAQVPGIDFGAGYTKALDALKQGSSKLAASLPNFKSSAAPQINDLVESLKPANGQMDGDVAVELSRTLRNEASQYFQSANRSASPQDAALARAYKGAASAVEDAVQSHLQNVGQGDLADQWDQARILIAKSHSVEDAMDGAGNVDATKLGKMLLRGKPLSDNLELAANFANKYPQVARNIRGSAPGVMTAGDVLTGALIDVATGNHVGLAVGPGRWLLRKTALSGLGQWAGHPGSSVAQAGLGAASAAALPASLAASDSTK